MLSVLAALALGSPGLWVSSAELDITPPELLPLGGYTERHGRVMDPGGDALHARALLFRHGSLKVALVSVETLTIPESLVREVAARLPLDVHLLLCATHTHCAPDSQMLNDQMTFLIPGIATYKRRWLPWYADKIAGAVKAALAAPRRRVERLNAETWRSDVNRGRRKGAAPDKAATLVSFGRHKPLFFEYAAHGTFYDAAENRTREDWPGGVTAVAPMALIGPIGDVSPKAPGLDQAAPATKIAKFWATILRDRRGSHNRTIWRNGGPISWVSERIPLAAPTPHPGFEPHALGQIMVTRFAPPSASVNVLRLGALAVIGVPGEPTSHIGRRIAHAGRMLGLRDVLVISHCDGWMGYILEPKDYDVGGYEAMLSFYGREEGDRVVQAAVRALQAVVGSSHFTRINPALLTPDSTRPRPASRPRLRATTTATPTRLTRPTLPR